MLGRRRSTKGQIADGNVSPSSGVSAGKNHRATQRQWVSFKPAPCPRPREASGSTGRAANCSKAGWSEPRPRWRAAEVRLFCVPKSAVLSRRLGAVTRRAQRLPVGSTPEQRHVATVRLDVVDHGGRCQLAASLVLTAQRVLGQERRACLAPLPGVATSRCVPASCVVLSLALLLGLDVCLAEARRVDQLPAAWVPADGLGSRRHHAAPEKGKGQPAKASPFEPIREETTAKKDPGELVPGTIDTPTPK